MTTANPFDESASSIIPSDLFLFILLFFFCVRLLSGVEIKRVYKRLSKAPRGAPLKILTASCHLHCIK